MKQARLYLSSFSAVVLMISSAAGAQVGFPVWGILSNAIVNPSSIKTLDLDGDGDADLMSVSLTQVSWWENTGGGRYLKRGEWDRGRWDNLVDVQDLDGDGKPDLLLLTYNDAGAEVLAVKKGLGLAGFADPVTIAPVSAGIVQVHDFTGDGKPDLFVDSQGWINRGDGSFTRAQNARPPYSYNPILWADVNGDGLDDMVTTSDRGLQWQKNLGGLQFDKAAALFTLPDSEPGLAGASRQWAFLNHPVLGPCFLLQQPNSTGEGKMSLIAAKAGSWRVVATLSIPQVAEGGRKRTVDTVPAPGGTVRILTEDVIPGKAARNGVAAPDTSVIGEIGIQASASGEATMTWKNVLRYPGPSVAPALADLNGDGKADLVLAVVPLRQATPSGLRYGDQIQWFAAQRSGAFAPKPNFATSLPLAGKICYVGDLDGDGDVDVLTECDAWRSAICLWRNEGPGLGFTQQVLYAKGTVSHVIKVDDHGGHGPVDIVIAAANAPAGSKTKTTEIVSLSRNSRGAFAQKVLYRGQGTLGESPALMDADQDGITDLFGADGGAGWLKGLPDGRLRALKKDEKLKFSQVILYGTDVDGDGDLDLVSSGYWLESGGANNGKIHSFPLGIPLTLGGHTVIVDGLIPAGADFDGDGRQDWLAAISGQMVPVLASASGDQTKPAFPLDENSPLGASLPTGNTSNFLDVNGDGLPDYIYRFRSDPSAAFSQVGWCENLGGGAFSPAKSFNLDEMGNDESLYDLIFHDLDGDGIPDLITTDDAGRVIWIKGVKE